MSNLTLSRRSLDFDDVSLLQRAGRRRRDVWRASHGALSLFQGLPQSVRPRLTALGGASQLPTWLARPRHQVWLRSAPCEACLPAPLSQNVCAQR